MKYFLGFSKKFAKKISFTFHILDDRKLKSFEILQNLQNEFNFAKLPIHGQT